MEHYPNNLIRGVANRSELNEEGLPSINLFLFRPNESRSDNKLELSINWCDDKTKALSIAMNQMKGDESGDFQFKVGVAVLSRERLDLVKKSLICMGKIGYERAPIENNEFHGNIVCTAGLSKQTMAIIRSSLAISVTSILFRE
jgi:hypothetical protein